MTSIPGLPPAFAVLSNAAGVENKPRAPTTTPDFQSQLKTHSKLREMTSDGLIERIDFDEKPLRVEYQLSEMGRQLLPVLIAARRFSTSHPPEAGDLSEAV